MFEFVQALMCLPAAVEYFLALMGEPYDYHPWQAAQG